MALAYIIQGLFRIPALSYFDDRFGKARQWLLKLGFDLITQAVPHPGRAVELAEPGAPSGVPPASDFGPPTRHQQSQGGQNEESLPGDQSVTSDQ